MKMEFKDGQYQVKKVRDLNPGNFFVWKVDNDIKKSADFFITGVAIDKKSYLDFEAGTVSSFQLKYFDTRDLDHDVFVMKVDGISFRA